MNDVEVRVKKIIAAQLCLGESEVQDNKSFVDDLGADSVDKVEIVMALEDEFGLDIQDEEADIITTVQEAVEYAVRHQRR